MADERDFEMVSVQSSQLAAVGYDKESKTMRVEFQNGSLYEYSGVDEGVYANLISAPSAGSFFNGIKNRYPFQRLS